MRLRPPISRAVDWVATGVEVAGIAIIVLGAMLATAVFLHRWRQRGMFPAAYRQYWGGGGVAPCLQRSRPAPSRQAG